MKLEEMRYYVEIVDAGSINQASKTLYVAQPALSRTIASLEKELGFALLERSKHGVKPTAAGKTVYNDCVRILGLASDCEKHWQTLAYENQADKEPITISIVALPMVCNSTMNQALATIANDYSRITTRLFERQLGDILETTVDQMPAIAISHYNKETKADIYAFAKSHDLQIIPLFDDMPAIAISHYNKETKADIYAFAKSHDLQIIPLFDDEYCFFANCDNPLTKQPVEEATLKGYTIAGYSNDEVETDHNFIAANLSGYYRLFKNVLHLSNRHEMMETAATTQVVALSALRMTQGNFYRRAGKLKLVHVKEFHLPMTYFMLYSKNPSIEEKIAADILQSFLQSLADIPLLQ